MQSAGSGDLPTYLEFFAGGGMVRAGLGSNWRCLFANDFDHKKAAIYRRNWGGDEFVECDIRAIKLSDLPKQAVDLVWASFPCQDLSLAGGGAGLKGDRSGTFWPFWKLMQSLHAANRTPSVVVLENVCGTLTSHKGKDFAAIVRAFSQIEFDVGAVVVDAELFVPQSRPRLFFIGVPKAVGMSARFTLLREESEHWHPPTLKRAYAGLPEKLKRNWIWWDFPLPAKRNIRLADLIEDDPQGVTWHSKSETAYLLSMMSPTNLKKVARAQELGRPVVGTMYRRTRRDEFGLPVQRVEVRFDEVAGCLRTPAGGSSRQQIMSVDKGRIRTRLISARETARLMGLDDTYILPDRCNEAYHLTGDGVVVPVVKHLSENVFPEFIKPKRRRRAA